MSSEDTRDRDTRAISLCGDTNSCHLPSAQSQSCETSFVLDPRLLSPAYLRYNHHAFLHRQKQQALHRDNIICRDNLVKREVHVNRESSSRDNVSGKDHVFKPGKTLDTEALTSRLQHESYVRHYEMSEHPPRDVDSSRSTCSPTCVSPCSSASGQWRIVLHKNSAKIIYFEN